MKQPIRKQLLLSEIPVVKPNVTAKEPFSTPSSELRPKNQELEDIPLLPDWPKDTRGAPNMCLRSALFGLIQRGKRRAVKGEIIAAVKGLDIRYTGWQLDQGDFDVLVQALHLQKHSVSITANQYTQFKVKGFLNAIGRQPGKSGREWLKDSFRRLTATAMEVNVEIKHRYMTDTFSYVGSLIDEFYYSEQEREYFLKINPKLASLFDAGWTQLQWQQRLRLKTDLAKWLHGFYASHRDPFPIKVVTYRHISGSSCGRLSDFRGKLCSALEELLAAGILTFWEIDHEDKVQVQKSNQGGIAVAERGHNSRNGWA
ncbi:MAG: TrfA family protein [uncultured bacterium]|nr:MAG: TrfA family protein [uncultured bacterium]